MKTTSSLLSSFLRDLESKRASFEDHELDPSDEEKKAKRRLEFNAVEENHENASPWLDSGSIKPEFKSTLPA